MSMIRDALSYLVDLARTERYKQIAETYEAYILVNRETGDTQKVMKPIPKTGATLLDLDSLEQAVNSIGTDGERSEDSAIFVSSSKVVFIADFFDGHHQTEFRLPLHPSPLFKFLGVTVTGDLKDVLRRYRFELSGNSVEVSPSDVFEKLSYLKFEQQSEQQHTVRTNDEGVSKSMKAKVSGASEIPAGFVVAFNAYPSLDEQISNVGNRVEINMDIHVDPTSGKITIRPIPGDIDQAETQALNAVRNEIVGRLDQYKEFTFLGSPYIH
jgi:hypothetical protein